MASALSATQNAILSQYCNSGLLVFRYLLLGKTRNFCLPPPPGLIYAMSFSTAVLISHPSTCYSRLAYASLTSTVGGKSNVTDSKNLGFYLSNFIFAVVCSFSTCDVMILRDGIFYILTYVITYSGLDNSMGSRKALFS